MNSATPLAPQALQALIVDLSGNRRGPLHAKLKEMGCAQVGSHASLQESKEACDRFAGPTLVLFFLDPDARPFNYVRFFQRGASKPVEVAIVAGESAGESLRQEFLNLNVAAFARSDDPAALAREIERLLADPARYFQPVAPRRPGAESSTSMESSSGVLRRREARPAGAAPGVPAESTPAPPPLSDSAPGVARPPRRGRAGVPVSWMIGGVATLLAGAAAGVGLFLLRDNPAPPSASAAPTSRPAAAAEAMPETLLANKVPADEGDSRLAAAGPSNPGDSFDPFAGIAAVPPSSGLPPPPPPPPSANGGAFAFESLGQLRDMEAARSLPSSEIVARGVVSFGGGAFARGRNQFFIQDDGGAIGMDDAGFRGGVLPHDGDLVEVRGKFEVFRGNLQIELTGTTKVLSRGHAAKALSASPRDFCDKLEARLVRLDRARVASGNLPRRAGDEGYLKVATPDGQIAELYVAKETRIFGATPTGEISVQGILMQWASGSSGGNFSWYVQPRRPEDIVALAP